MQVQINSIEQVGTITIQRAADRQQPFDRARFLADNRHAQSLFQASDEQCRNFRDRLTLTAGHLIADGRLNDARRFLGDFDVVAARVALERSARGVIADLQELETHLLPEAAADVKTIRRALQLAENVVGMAAGQLPEQLLARLGPLPETSGLRGFYQRARQYKSQSWLRPLRASLETPDSPLEETLDFQENLIAAAGIDPDGKHLWVVGDSQLVGWDLLKRKVVVTLRLRDASPTSVASDGKRVVVTTRDGPVLVFEPEIGRRLPALAGHQRAALDAKFLRSNLLVTVGTDGFVRSWDVRQGVEIACWATGAGAAHCLLPISPTMFAVGVDPDQPRRDTIQLWDWERKSPVAHFGEHSWSVDRLAVNADYTLLAAGANDEITVWRLADQTCLRRLFTPNAKCHALAFISSTLLVSGDSSGELRVWDIESGTEVRRLPSHSGLVSDLCVASPGKEFVSTSWDQTIRLWSVERVLTPPPLGHSQQVTCLAYSPDESQVISGSQDGKILLWDARNGQALSVLHGHRHWISGIWIGDHIVSASWDGTLRIWDSHSQRCLREIATGDEHVYKMACTPDGARAATVGTKGLIRVWNTATGAQLVATQSSDPDIRSLEIVGDTRLRWGTVRRQLFDWAMDESPPQVITLPGATPATTWDLMERSGCSVVGLANGRLHLFDRDGQTVGEFGIPGCGPSAIVRSEDGAAVLVANGLPQMASDNIARLWMTSDLRAPVAEFITDTPLTAASVSRDGTRVVLGDVAGAVHFLEWIGAEPRSFGHWSK